MYLLMPRHLLVCRQFSIRMRMILCAQRARHVALITCVRRARRVASVLRTAYRRATRQTKLAAATGDEWRRYSLLSLLNVALQ